MSNALQVVSLVMSVVGPGGGPGGGGGGSAPNNPDRIDTISAGSGENVDDLDLAMGTLMAYGGKYLR